VARVSVVVGRAETLARDPRLRSAFPLVLARSFGPPAVTAEIGGAFLAIGGCLAVSEPPQSTGDSDNAGPPRPADRWPERELGDLGLGPAAIETGPAAGAAITRRVRTVDDRWPRPVGIPARHPLW
jgi:16S rRNA (guanine527-N7)-methyltransferase